MVQEQFDPENILGEPEKQMLDEAISIAEAVRPLVQRAKQAGIDLGDLESQLNQQEESARKIRQNFFPGT